MKNIIITITTITAVIMLMLIGSPAKMFAQEVNKKDIWEAGKVYERIYYSQKDFYGYELLGGFAFTDNPKVNPYYYYFASVVTPHSLRKSVNHYLLFEPKDYYGTTLYGDYLVEEEITLYKDIKERKKAYKGKPHNAIDIKFTITYEPKIGYKIYTRVYDKQYAKQGKSTAEFEDMVIGFVDTNNNTYICNAKTSKMSIVYYKIERANTNRYIGEAVLSIPDNYTNIDNMGFYISNNYLPGIYICGGVSDMVKGSRYAYDRFKEAESKIERAIKLKAYTGFGRSYEDAKQDWAERKKDIDRELREFKAIHGGNAYKGYVYGYTVYTENDKYYILVDGNKIYGKPFTESPLYFRKFFKGYPLVYWELHSSIYIINDNTREYVYLKI